MKTESYCDACQCDPCDCSWGNYPTQPCERCGLLDCECHWGDQIEKENTNAKNKTQSNDIRIR